MKCPVDNAELTMSERSGIEIDYCPQCRGVWLDRGELDKIIDRSAATQYSPSSQAPTEQQSRPAQRQQYDDEYHYDSRHKKKKRESFLGDLFDF